MRDLLLGAARTALPVPGQGSTPQRFEQLYDLARTDLQLARLAEAHHDAVAIAAAAGRALVSGALYGVWAASGPDPLIVRRSSTEAGSLRLRGTAPWGSGIGIVDRALVTARDDADGPGLLVDVALSRGTVVESAAPWLSPAFASTGTGSMSFDCCIDPSDVIGEPGSYLARSGFWHGAIGVAACWAGGLHGLYDLHLARWTRRDQHSLAHLGSAAAAVEAMRAVLDRAAIDIDAAPTDVVAAERRARAVRHTVERLCTSAIDDLGVGAGPEPLAFDEAIIARTQQVQLYVRQFHGERDLAPLGQSLLDGRA